VAVYNGLSENALLLAGTTVYVPTVEEGSGALASGTPAASTPSTAGVTTRAADAAAATTTAVVPAPWMSHVPSPYGELHLLPAAAEAWNPMRAEALSAYGTDIYPGGPLSAYRTYGQQAELYEFGTVGVRQRIPGSAAAIAESGVAEAAAAAAAARPWGWRRRQPARWARRSGAVRPLAARLIPHLPRIMEGRVDGA
jgi:hypothetical protein